MNTHSYPIELLAPARTAESGMIAIKYGADAVYAGAPKFGARASVGNSLEDMEKLIGYAHKFRAKVYTALNTILRDDEIEEAVSIIRSLYNIGIDGIIIQDMGLTEWDLPPVRLIASTQTNNTDAAKVKFLEDAGFTRVILARELSISQIRDIRSKTTTELECFVHGAICVGYSGQCYLSYAMGGRSGNRGVCAQPCRDLYSLEDTNGKSIKKNKYLLSLRDMCLAENLEELIDAGITSFKIEGRLKDDNYLKNITAFYRQKLDILIERKNLQKASSGRILYDFTPDPAKSFNRGFTEYFFHNSGENISSTETPKSRGELIGRVISVEGENILIETKKNLTAGDGICFRTQSGEFSGTFVNRAEKNRINVQDPSGIKNGIEIFRNFDKDFCDKLDSSKTERKIEVKFTIEHQDGDCILSVTEEGGIKAEIRIEDNGERARDFLKYSDVLKKCLSKLGDTIFSCEGTAINTEEIPFHPVSVLNGLRRELMSQLEQKIIQMYKPEEIRFERNSISYPAASLDYRGNVLNRYALDFYRRHGVKNISPAAETGIKMNEKTVMKTRYCLKQELGLCRGIRLESENRQPMFLIDKKGRKFRVEFTCGECGMEISG